MLTDFVLALTGGSVLIGDDSGFTDADLVIRSGRVDRITPRSGSGEASDERSTVVDVAGLRLVPGFIDLQVNGIAGIDLCSEPERIAEVARYLPRFGVTSFLPTIATSPPSAIARALAEMGRVGSERTVDGGARPLGLHLEGPMLSPERKGSHPPMLLRDPSTAVIDGWSADAGVAMVTLAPELPGADEVIRLLLENGVCVFAGHTNASADVIVRALDMGVRGVTHLFNAMPGLRHRDPSPVGVAFTDPRITAGLIVDGVHVHPMAVAVAYSCLGPSRLALVSDAVAATAMPPGSYAFGGAELVTDGVSVRLPDGTLAGSVLTLDAAIRNLVSFAGCSLVDAIRCATSTPARVLGRSDLGVLRPGALADVVALDDVGNVVLTVVGGVIVHRGDGTTPTWGSTSS